MSRAEYGQSERDGLPMLHCIIGMFMQNVAHLSAMTVSDVVSPARATPLDSIVADASRLKPAIIPSKKGEAVVWGDHPSALQAILDPGCALAIWEQTLPDDPAGLVDALYLDTVDDVDATLPTAEAAIHAAVLLGAAGYEGQTAVALASEIGEMAARLALVAPADQLRVRLEVVDTDACRRFHADSVTLRLLSTLRGPGTQWIEIDRPDDIRDIPTGAIALFKGRLLIDEPTILHRSPPIAGTGVRRLVLVIDPL